MDGKTAHTLLLKEYHLRLSNMEGVGVAGMFIHVKDWLTLAKQHKNLLRTSTAFCYVPSSVISKAL